MESTIVGEAQVGCCRKGDRSSHVQRCRWANHNTRRIHQEEIGLSKPAGLNGAENRGGLSPGDTAEDSRRIQAGVVQKVCDDACGDIEDAEAVKQVCTCSGSTGDVVLHSSSRWSRGEIDLRSEP